MHDEMKICSVTPDTENVLCVMITIDRLVILVQELDKKLLEKLLQLVHFFVVVWKHTLKQVPDLKN